MTSVIRNYQIRKEGLTRFIKPESPCYDISGEVNVLFPFSYENGVLDITYSGNNFKQRMVDISGQAPESETETAVSINSGPYLVSSLGSNFKDYIRAWRYNTIDAGSPIQIYIAPQMLRVQEANRVNVNSDSGDSYTISTKAPASDTYPVGSVANSYQSTYIFKTPLTFTIIESGVVKYITFRTVLDQE
jgi:hypothetical protein